MDSNPILGDGLICYRPTGGVGFLLLFFFLNLNPHHGRSWREHAREFDFVGLILIIGGVVLVLPGSVFSFHVDRGESELRGERVVGVGIDGPPIGIGGDVEERA